MRAAAVGAAYWSSTWFLAWASARALACSTTIPSDCRCARADFALGLYVRLRPDEVSYIVEHSGATMLLIDPELEDSLRGIDTKHRLSNCFVRV